MASSSSDEIIERQTEIWLENTFAAIRLRFEEDAAEMYYASKAREHYLFVICVRLPG